MSLATKISNLPAQSTFDDATLSTLADDDRHAAGIAPIAQTLTMATAMLVPLAGTVAAVVLAWRYGWMNWLNLGLLLGGWLLTELGVTIGFHRLLSHRSFETYRGVRAFWAILGCMSVQGQPLIWSAIHRRHHALSDQPGDPHSPQLFGTGWWNTFRGLFYSHVGWLYRDYWSKPQLEKYVPDLLADPWLVRIDRWYLPWMLCGFAIPTAIGGLVTGTWQGAVLGLLWGGFVRTFVGHHCTWTINSICHVFGRRDYDAGDQSRNNFLSALLSQGEGWHNNHHAFPSVAKFGFEWWQFDMSWLVIRGMQVVGLVWNVKLPNPRLLAAKRIR